MLVAAARASQTAFTAEERLAILPAILAALETKARSLSPEELYTRAQIHRELDQPSAAERDLRAALATRPERAEWRRELDFLLKERIQQRSPIADPLAEVNISGRCEAKLLWRSVGRRRSYPNIPLSHYPHGSSNTRSLELPSILASANCDRRDDVPPQSASPNGRREWILPPSPLVLC